MTGPPLHRDAADDVGPLRAWAGLPPGPAGLLTVEPVAGLVLVFDAADLGRVVEAQFDTAAVDSAAADAVGLAGDATEWQPEPSEVLRVLGRRALLDGLGTGDPLAAVDDALLGLDLPESLRPALIDPTVARATIALLDVRPATWRQVTPALLEDAGSAAQQLADALGHEDRDAPRLAALARQLVETAERRQQPHELRRAAAQAPSAVSAADVAPPMAMAAMAASLHDEPEPEPPIDVLVDPRAAAAAGIDGVTATPAGQLLTVSARVVGDLGQAWARVWERRTGRLLATGRIVGSLYAQARLPLPPGVSRDDVEVEVTDDPRALRTTTATVQRADALRAGWDAVTAERLGASAVREAWLDAAEAWAMLGDADRHALAMDYAQVPVVADTATWALPLLGQPRLVPAPFLHERIRLRGAPRMSGSGWTPPS